MTMIPLGLILEAVDGAHYVFFDKDNLRLFVWNGAHTVNIYGARSGQLVDVFTTDHGRKWSVREIHDLIQEHISAMD